MKLLLTIAASCMLLVASAQENTLLFHYNRYKEATYNVGDVISFRIKGNEEKITWQITEITDSKIVSRDQSIAPHEIRHIYVDEKSRIWFPFRFKWTRILLFSGVGYFLIDWANSGEISPGTLVVSGTLLGASLISKIIIKKYIKLEGGRKLVILR